jgi:DNA-binding NarL/FixJ family response regulator
MEMIRVLVCDDQTVVREGLAAILSTDPEIEVVGMAGNGKEALALVPEAHPDLVLMDLQMPVMNGVEATQQLRGRYPTVRILVLTTYAEDKWVFEAIGAGAAGYLLKDSRRDELLAAIKGTVEGKAFLDPSIAGKVMQQAAAGTRSAHERDPQVKQLTERELEILRLLTQGHTNPEIARRLHLAPGTVRNYVSAILQKLDVSDRTQAAVTALQRGLIEAP